MKKRLVLGRALAVLVALLLVLVSSTAGAVSFRKATPQGNVGISRPAISQQFLLGEGESILRASMWLDGIRVEPTWDATGLVSYTPPVALSGGSHTVRLSVEVDTGKSGFRYDPIVSSFTFNVQNGALEVLPAPGPEELRTLARVNQYRRAAGLAPLTYNAALGTASARHAQYLVANPAQQDLDAHGEVSGRPGYTGQNGTQRARYFGYGGGTAEIINFTEKAEEAVDGWMDTIYHRLPMLYPGNREIGYGLAAGGTNPVNVLLAGPNEYVAGTVLWPYDGQTGVPTAWDGLEVPDPFRLYPGAPKPVGYTITLTFAGTVQSLTLDSYRLTGPQGAVEAMKFDPVIDNHLEDTVALIPYAPLQPATRYTVTMSGQVDQGEGVRPYSRTWSFTTAGEHPPAVRRMSSRTRGDLLTSVALEGTGFGQGLRVFLGGLPVDGLRVESETRVSFQPPVGLVTGSQDLLVATQGGRELVWRDFLDDPALRYPAGEAFAAVPVTVHGQKLPVSALNHKGGAGLLLPEQALAELGAARSDVRQIDRTYWTWVGKTGDYTVGRVAATVGEQSFVAGLPVQVRSGTVYVDREFVSRLTGEPLQIADGTVSLGLRDLAGHWARPQILRLLRDGIVSGVGTGQYRPGDPLTRAAFVKMLAGARGMQVQPGQTGSFRDTASHWVATQGFIGAAVAAGVVVPAEYPDGRFLPDQAITREEMAVMVTRALGLDARARALRLEVVDGVATVNGKPFADAGRWTRPGYVAVAVQEGIITGYQESDGRSTFRPALLATRAEAAVMVVRTLDHRQP